MDDDSAAANFKKMRAEAKARASQQGSTAHRKAREKRASSPDDARRDRLPRSAPQRPVQLNVTVRQEIKHLARMARVEFDMTIAEFVETAIEDLFQKLKNQAAPQQ